MPINELIEVIMRTRRRSPEAGMDLIVRDALALLVWSIWLIWFIELVWFNQTRQTKQTK